jgi:hypothetical protein
MAHDVFISHSAKDKATGDAVCAMLESNGVRCWIAPRDVTPGMEWGECIIEAIEESRVMILVFTNHANESPQIRHEVERAVNYGVAILPVRIEDVIPGRALEYFIGNVHWLDALTPPLETHLKSLAGTVKILLARMPVRGGPMPATPTQPTGVPSPSANPIASPPLPAAPKMEIPELAKMERVEVAPESARNIQAAAGIEQPATQNQIPTAIPLTWPDGTPAYAYPSAAQPAAQAPGNFAFPPPPPQFPSNVAVAGKRKRPILVTIVACMCILEAGICLFGLGQDFIRSHFDFYDAVALGLAGIDIGASIGLFKLMTWGRILKSIFAAILIALLFNAIGEASREGVASFALWLGLVLYFAGTIVYMFTRQVKQAFRR